MTQHAPSQDRRPGRIHPSEHSILYSLFKCHVCSRFLWFHVGSVFMPVFLGFWFGFHIGSVCMAALFSCRPCFHVGSGSTICYMFWGNMRVHWLPPGGGSRDPTTLVHTHGLTASQRCFPQTRRGGERKADLDNSPEHRTTVRLADLMPLRRR